MDTHKDNHVVTNNTNDIIHGVRITTYDKLGDESSSTYIAGDKLHEYVYHCRTKKFTKLSKYHDGKKKKFMTKFGK